MANIDKICIYAKDPFEAKYRLLINKREGVGLQHCNGTKAFMEHSNDKNDIYKNIDAYNPNKKWKYWSYLMIYWFAGYQNSATSSNQIIDQKQENKYCESESQTNVKV